MAKESPPVSRFVSPPLRASKDLRDKGPALGSNHGPPPPKGLPEFLLP